MVKKTLLILFLLVGIITVWQIDFLWYALQQGRGQAKILWEARPIEKVLLDNNFPDSLKTKIKLIEEIRKFAIKELKLKDSKNYTTIYNQHNKPILWVVNACPPFQLIEHKWHYPFLGDLGYKGFFDIKKAKKEEAKMKELGMDTQIGEINAWSTLGWFNDPILSNMLYLSEGQLARLIIHELTHATLYVKDNADFSENLATFVGDMGAYSFLEFKYGKNAKEYTDYKNGIRDIKKFSKHILKGSQQLNSLYQSKQFLTLTKIEKLKKKEQKIKTIISLLDSISFSKENKYQKFRNSKKIPNNTFFISYKMYREKQDSLALLFEKKFNSDFNNFFKYLKNNYQGV